MSGLVKIKSALISVFYKDNLESIVNKLNELGVTIYSTGGTQTFIENLGGKVIAVETLTGFPSILGGRVKTLHPKVFGGILNRRSNSEDQQQLQSYSIPSIDLVIVDLYPFEETVKSAQSSEQIIEKIDIGGVSLIRAAAKNFEDVTVIADKGQYAFLEQMLSTNNGSTTLEDRKKLAASAFKITSHYDDLIQQYLFDKESHSSSAPEFQLEITAAKQLRYGENPHQKGTFYGDINGAFEILNGKELSYNNLLDLDAGLGLLAEFSEPTCAVIKHNNACGLASAENVLVAWQKALAGDPVSAFGGVICFNKAIDLQTAQEVDHLFFEIIIAPGYEPKALEVLCKKPNRIVLVQKPFSFANQSIRTALNGVLVQDRDSSIEGRAQMKLATSNAPAENQWADLEFALKIAKHTKSNTIVLAKNKQLLANGGGQTSRVDALKQAIEKAKGFNFDLQDSVMASDAFFPFPDCVEIAGKAGVTAVVQPGGSIKDSASVAYCNANNIAMVLTGIRHFKH